MEPNMTFHIAISPQESEALELANWHDTAKARKVIAQIERADFTFDFHRNFIRSGGERDWLPETSRGFEIEEELDELRRDFIADLTGFHPDEHTTEAQMDDWIAADRLQATVSEVIAAAIRQRGHLGWVQWEASKELAARNREGG
jgi:hypothetical protein